LQQGECIMNDNKGIFETIIEVLRKANIGFSIHEIKEIFTTEKKDLRKANIGFSIHEIKEIFTTEKKDERKETKEKKVDTSVKKLK